jgi:DNA-binding IclR family transcriptional regulator
LNILEVVRDGRAPLRAIDIARAVGLGSATANNIVRTLYIRGYLDQDEDGRYLLGGQSYLLGLAADTWGALRKAARGPMRELSEKTNCSSLLFVEYQSQLMAVHLTRKQEVFQEHSVRQDWRNRMHSTAAGKMILSEMTEERFAAFKNSYKLERFTERTIVDWDVLEAERKAIRERGYAINQDEDLYGATSISVPVRDQDGVFLASLIVTFSSYFLNDEYKAKSLAALREASEAMSEGYKGK